MYDPLVLLLVISETQPSQIFAFDPFVKESYLVNKLNHEDSEPDLLNARVKSDIAIYSNEDLPKEAGCIRVYCRLYTNAIQAMQFRTPPISFLYQQNRLPNHSLKPKPHYRHGEIRSPRKECFLVPFTYIHSIYYSRHLYSHPGRQEACKALGLKPIQSWCRRRFKPQDHFLHRVQTICQQVHIPGQSRYAMLQIFQLPKRKNRLTDTWHVGSI